MSGPRRIQRKRTKGWRMPEGTIDEPDCHVDFLLEVANS